MSCHAPACCMRQWGHEQCSAHEQGARQRRQCDGLEEGSSATTCLDENRCKNAELPHHQAPATPHMYYIRASQDALTCQSFKPAIGADLDRLLLGTTVAHVSCSLPFLSPGPRIRHCRLHCGCNRFLLR